MSTESACLCVCVEKGERGREGGRGGKCLSTHIAVNDNYLCDDDDNDAGNNVQDTIDIVSGVFRMKRNHHLCRKEKCFWCVRRTFSILTFSECVQSICITCNVLPSSPPTTRTPMTTLKVELIFDTIIAVWPSKLCKRIRIFVLVFAINGSIWLLLFFFFLDYLFRTTRTNTPDTAIHNAQVLVFDWRIVDLCSVHGTSHDERAICVPCCVLCRIQAFVFVFVCVWHFHWLIFFLVVR